MPLGMRHSTKVVTIHDLYPLVIPGYCSKAKQAYFRYVSRQNAKNAAQVICVSQNTKADVIRELGIEADKITVISQGYSKYFVPEVNDGVCQSLKEKYALPDKFLLYTGNHKSHKNLTRLFYAYKELKQSIRKQWPIVLTGPIVQETATLKQLAVTLGIHHQIQFIGMVDSDELPALNAMASLLLLPSIYEGFGIPLVEAMACGTPVVCSNVSAIPEVVGQAGRLFNPYDISDIAKVVSRAVECDIDNPETKQGCIERAQSFSWQKTTNKTYQVYKQVCAK